MHLNAKTLEQLRIIINGDNTSNYRSGPDLVAFFNELGFEDQYQYGHGFPSRWQFTDNKLKIINGTPELDECIKNAFAVINYIERMDELDKLISHFNKYLAFDKWQVVRDNDEITFKKLDKLIINTSKIAVDIDEDAFLKLTYDVDIESLDLAQNMTEVIKMRIAEVENCINNEAPLASIFLIGSIMEGILLGVALAYPCQFNQAQSSPKDPKTSKVKQFPDWTLNNFIDTAAEIGILKYDVKKFSHAVRDFRNYIHPYSQIQSQFSPDKQTALICFQVLKAAISQINDYRKNLRYSGED